MQENQKEKILWGIFGVTIIFAVLKIVSSSFSSTTSELILIDQILLFLPVLLLFLHLFLKLGAIRGLFLVFLSVIVGFIAEVVSVKYGTVFGSPYRYRAFSWMFFGVPALVPIYWAVFIYTGYTLVSSFLFWIGSDKPNRKQGNAVLLPILIFLDGLVVTAIDVFMDPLQVKAGNWVWLEEGPFFGVPIGNFVGWFLVTVFSTGIFRIFEYFSPKPIPASGRSIFLIPVIGYGVLCLCFLLTALDRQMADLALIGFFAMMPVVLVNLMLFVNWRMRKDNL